VKSIEQKHIQIEGWDKHPITLDITLPVSKTKTPVIVFCHGFKGFKDWGHYNWVARQCAAEGLAFLKFNFSHNGIVPPRLDELSDMEAFGNNNYTIELDDLTRVLDFIDEKYEDYNINRNEIYLVAHSRGGGIALLKGSEDKRVKKIVLWASLSEFESFFRPSTIEEWNKNGVVYAENKRTGQQLPIKKQLYDNYLENKSSLDVQKAAKLLAIPLLIIHGDQDESVDIKHAETLYNLVQHSILIKVEGGNHTFSAKHPFDPEQDVTPMLEELVENTVEFLKD
jgi:pimeloyl-ACP methyl ester carboxylesterase